MIAKTIPQSLRDSSLCTREPLTSCVLHDSSLCWGGAFLVWIRCVGVPFTGGAFWHLCCTAVSFAKESLFYFPIYRKKADAVRSAFASIHFYLCKNVLAAYASSGAASSSAASSASISSSASHASQMLHPGAKSSSQLQRGSNSSPKQS